MGQVSNAQTVAPSLDPNQRNLINAQTSFLTGGGKGGFPGPGGVAGGPEIFQPRPGAYPKVKTPKQIDREEYDDPRQGFGHLTEPSQPPVEKMPGPAPIFGKGGDGNKGGFTGPGIQLTDDQRNVIASQAGFFNNSLQPSASGQGSPFESGAQFDQNT